MRMEFREQKSDDKRRSNWLCQILIKDRILVNGKVSFEDILIALTIFSLASVLLMDPGPQTLPSLWLLTD